MSVIKKITFAYTQYNKDYGEMKFCEKDHTETFQLLFPDQFKACTMLFSTAFSQDPSSCDSPANFPRSGI